jgi:hypothetical protein
MTIVGAGFVWLGTSERRLTADYWPRGRNQLAAWTELPYDILVFEARQVVRMHEPAVHEETVPDPRARWRDLIRGSGEPGTLYLQQRCGACTEDDGCAYLDAARLFVEVVGPYLPDVTAEPPP